MRLPGIGSVVWKLLMLRASRGVARAWANTMIVFTAPDHELEHLDIARGPHVPGAARSKPLAGAFSLFTGTPGEIEALYSIVVPVAAGGPWASVKTSGRGRLHTFSTEFAGALADFSLRYQERPKNDPDRHLVHERLDELTPVWIARRGTPARGTSDRMAISTACGTARRAAKNGWKLFAWFGPTMGTPVSIQRSANHVTLRDAD